MFRATAPNYRRNRLCADLVLSCLGRLYGQGSGNCRWRHNNPFKRGQGSYPIIGANFAVAAGCYPEAAPLVFMIGIVWLLLVTAATFVSLLSTGGRGIK